MNKQIVSIYIQDTYGEKAPSTKKLKKDNPRIYNALYEYTDYLPKSATITERSYNVSKGLSDRPICKCGKILKFKSYKSGYGTKCSKTCKG
jgi:hypothetical protein